MTMMMQERVAVVTGAGSGIGRAVSVALEKAGYSLVLAGRRLQELERTASMASVHGRMKAIPADVTAEGSVRALFAQVRAQFGRVDVLFNNAGISGPEKPVEELTLEDWNQV